ncbi:MAG: hypothetical protein ACJ71S_06060 [Acidobacteriaceae bacterium]
MIGTAEQSKPLQLERTNRRVRNLMPYASKAQQGYFNANRRKLGNKLVNEFNQASKGQKDLPEHVKNDEDADDMPAQQAKVRRLNAMTKLYPEKKPKTENVDLGSKGSFTVKKGALHSMLGIAQDKTIPKTREEAAAKSSNPTLKRRAISALGFRAMK